MTKPATSILAIIAAAVIFFAATISMLVFPIQPPLVSSSQVSKTPTVNITLYGGEISTTKFGFGLTPTNLTSPGPTLVFKTTDVVNLTFVNAGKMPHAFVVTELPTYTAKHLFNSAIASATNPLNSGQSGTAIFQPSTIENVYYICPIPGHADSFGMWGEVTITMSP
jgi:uncharacterized cupredoxin-like copper-binding protein